MFFQIFRSFVPNCCVRSFIHFISWARHLFVILNQHPFHILRMREGKGREGKSHLVRSSLDLIRMICCLLADHIHIPLQRNVDRRNQVMTMQCSHKTLECTAPEL
jgi:hypothetical protein